MEGFGIAKFQFFFLVESSREASQSWVVHFETQGKPAALEAGPHLPPLCFPPQLGEAPPGAPARLVSFTMRPALPSLLHSPGTYCLAISSMSSPLPHGS